MRLRSKKEEIANAVSHGAGIVFGLMSLPILVFLAIKNKGFLESVPFIVYAISFIFLFVSSTLYHATANKKLKSKFKIMDHIAIYFMIAGSYTPFIFACFNGVSQWVLAAVMWSIVLFGTIFKLKFTGRFENLSLLIYLSMGWMVIFLIKPLYQILDGLSLALVIAGGIAYTAGVYFYAKDSKKYHHLVWHIFVLTGSIIHFVAILLRVI